MNIIFQREWIGIAFKLWIVPLLTQNECVLRLCYAKFRFFPLESRSDPSSSDGEEVRFISPDPRSTWLYWFVYVYGARCSVVFMRSLLVAMWELSHMLIARVLCFLASWMLGDGTSSSASECIFCVLHSRRKSYLCDSREENWDYSTLGFAKEQGSY